MLTWNNCSLASVIRKCRFLKPEFQNLHLLMIKSSPLYTHNSVITSTIEKYKIQFSRSCSEWAFLWKWHIATEMLMLTAQTIDKINATCNKYVLRSIGTLRNHYLRRHRNDFIYIRKHWIPWKILFFQERIIVIWLIF